MFWLIAAQLVNPYSPQTNAYEYVQRQNEIAMQGTMQGMRLPPLVDGSNPSHPINNLNCQGGTCRNLNGQGFRCTPTGNGQVSCVTFGY